MNYLGNYGLQWFSAQTTTTISKIIRISLSSIFCLVIREESLRHNTKTLQVTQII